MIYKDESGFFPESSYTPCVSGDLQCFFDLDGRMYACNGTWEDGLNYFETGFEKAWNYLKDRKCISCRCIGMTELHTLLSLNLSNFVNAAVSVMKKI